MTLLFLLFFSFPGHTLDDGNRVQIAVEAEIFAQADFKAKVIERLKPGTVITLLTDKLVGASGLGVFYKVRTPQGNIGFVTDSDILATGG